jgi:hypothetical protein
MDQSQNPVDRFSFQSRPAGHAAARATLRNTTHRLGITIPACHSNVLPSIRRGQEIFMKTIAIFMLAIAAAGCSTMGTKPYRASDTTASAPDESRSTGPTQRSTQRMFNPDGSLGPYFGT